MAFSMTRSTSIFFSKISFNFPLVLARENEKERDYYLGQED